MKSSTKSTRPTRSMAIAACLALTVGLGSASLGAIALAPAASAAQVSGTVIAQDIRSLIQVTAPAPSALAVKSSPGSMVTAKLVGSKKVTTKKANRQAIATFTKLKAGSSYEISVNGETTVAIPVIPVTPASHLTVATTASPDSVHLSWKHQTKKPQGPVSYRVSANPVTGEGSITNTVSALETTLVGLDTNKRYEFTVTPLNLLGDGQASVALMSRSLNDINGVAQSGQAGESVAVTPQVSPPSPTPAPAPAASNATPTPAPAPAPKPAAPTTKTIYVCPDGFTDNNGICETTTPYTFHMETETRNYSYHTEMENYGPWKDFGTDWSGTTCPNGGTMHDGKCMGFDQRPVSVKDQTPAGFTDTGSNWTKQTQVKDQTPSGYSDNGTTWVKVAAKVAKVVPV